MKEKELLEGAAYWAMTLWREEYEKDVDPTMKNASLALFKRYEALYEKLSGGAK